MYYPILNNNNLTRIDFDTDFDFDTDGLLKLVPFGSAQCFMTFAGSMPSWTFGPG